MRGVFRRLLVSTALSVIAVLAPPIVCAQAAYQFELPAQSLADSLRAIGRQTSTNILFESHIVKDVQAPALYAQLTISEAIGRLLVGTPLSIRRTSADTLIVERATRDASKSPEKNVVTPSTSAVSEMNSYTHLAQARILNVEQAEDPATAHGKLEEIIVTAQKRTERLIDVPQAVTVLSANELSRTGALQFRDFAGSVPGLSFNTNGPGYTLVSLRGVTTGFIETSATVGIYVDEVPYGSSSAFAQGARTALDVALFDIDRVEVLKGPQGTLYGASTMGGLIKYVSKQPDTESFNGEARVGVAGTNEGGAGYNAAAAINAPISSGKAALRASGFRSHDGGYIDNVARGDNDADSADISGGRADLLLTPGESLSVRLTAFLQDIDRDGEGTADYSLLGEPQEGELDQRRLLSEPFRSQFRLVSGTLAYELPGATLTSISSYQTAETKLDSDVSQYYVPILAGLGSFSAVGIKQATSTDKFTQEIRLASAGTKSTLEWVIGTFYTREDSEAKQEFLLRDPAGNPAANNLLHYAAPSVYEEYAGFGDLTWNVTDKFNVTGGLRYARNRQRLEQIGSGLFVRSFAERSSSEDVFTYLANARYHFSDHATAYARYASGYRPGGPTLLFLDPTTGLPISPPSFEADELKSYEAGFKGETEDRRFGIDVAGYYVDWTHVQLNVCRGGFCFISNADSGASVRGVELALTARPLDSFSMSGALAYQDAHLSEADPDFGGAKGERLPGVPRFTAALSADYLFQRDGWRPSMGATMRYVSDRWALFNNNPAYAQYHLPDYVTVDLRAGTTFGTMDLQLYVRNLFDERGQLSTRTWFGNSRLAITQPRTIGISTAVKF